MASFAIDLSQFENLTKERTRLVIKKITMEAFRQVILGTPVDTGRARGNWQAAIGAPSSTPIEDMDPVGSTTVARALSMVESWNANDQVGMFLINNLPYISVLEDGSSTQAPNGMVKRVLSGFPQIVEVESNGA